MHAHALVQRGIAWACLEESGYRYLAVFIRSDIQGKTELKS